MKQLLAFDQSNTDEMKPKQKIMGWTTKTSTADGNCSQEIISCEFIESNPMSHSTNHMIH